MRSVGVWPDNPWPHDMVISVDDTPHTLLTLLYVRCAWDLAPDAAVPDVEPLPERGTSAPPDSATLDEWSRRWQTAWEGAWDWYEPRDSRLGRPTWDEFVSLVPSESALAALPTTWEAEYGRDGIDRDALTRWTLALCDRHPVPLDEQPERRNLDALVPAWRMGIDSILVLPYRGYHARRIGSHHLVVSKATRDDPTLYDRALRSVV